jgi:hypothetical protein
VVQRIRHDRGGGKLLQSLAAPVDLRVYQGRAARVQPLGDGLEYDWGTEYRDASELQRIVNQLPGKPITLLHPGGLIAEGTPAQIVGKVRSSKLVDGYALVDFEVADPAGRAAADGGVHELSLGYTCRTDETGFQRGTVVDHLAMVPAARCGPTCEFRPDAASHRDCESGSPVQGDVQDCSCKIRAMRYVSLDTLGSSREATMDPQELQKQLDAANTARDAEKTRADEAQRAYQVAKERADRAELARADAERARVAAEVVATNAQAVLAAEKTRADQATQALAAEKTRADQAEAKARTDGAATFDARVNARSKLFDAANRILGAVDKDNKPVDRSAMNDRDIKIAIIRHVDGAGFDPTPHQAAQGAHFDAFVDGVFEGALGRHGNAVQSRAAVRETVQQSRETVRGDRRGPGPGAREDGLDNEETAERRMREDATTSWSRPRRRAAR